jgi:hypothetical protein
LNRSTTLHASKGHEALFGVWTGDGSDRSILGACYRNCGSETEMVTRVGVRRSAAERRPRRRILWRAAHRRLQVEEDALIREGNSCCLQNAHPSKSPTWDCPQHLTSSGFRLRRLSPATFAMLPLLPSRTSSLGRTRRLCHSTTDFRPR